MCANRHFRVTVNLSNFFHDHRNKARIFINDGIKKISDLEDRIKTIFHLNKIHLTSENEFLPPSEDVGILQNNEMIWVRQNGDHYDEPTYRTEIETKKTIKKSCKKRRPSIEECADNEIKSLKKKQKRISTTTEGLLSPQNEEPEKIKEKKKSINEQKSLKQKKKKTHNLDQTKQESTQLPCSPNEKAKKKKKKLDVNVTTKKKTKDASTKQKKIKTTLVEKSTNEKATTVVDGATGPHNSIRLRFHHKKTKARIYPDIVLKVHREFPSSEALPTDKHLVPTTTGQYLQQKKINIVKIDYLNKTNDSANSNKNKTEILNNTPNTNKSDCQDDGEGKPQEEPMAVDMSYGSNQTLPIAQAERESVCEGNTTEADVEESVLNSTLPNQTKICSESKKTSSPIKEREYEQAATEKTSEVKASLAMDTSEEGADICRAEHSLSDTGLGSLPSLSGKEFDCGDGGDAEDVNTLLDETIKPSDTSMLDLTKDYESCSSLTSVYSKCTITSGVGHLLTDLRANDSVVSVDGANSDVNDSTRRQRKRVRRKKKKNSKNIDTSAESSVVSEKAVPVTKLMKGGGPALHIKFEEAKDGTLIPIKIKGKRESLLYSEQSTIHSITKNFIDEKDILSSPLMMPSRFPRIGDIIAFKILIIQENFTPGLSSQIMGKVLQFDKKSDKVLFEILSGLDQCDLPIGMASIEEDPETKETENNQREFDWAIQVTEPRLLYPQLNKI